MGKILCHWIVSYEQVLAKAGKGFWLIIRVSTPAFANTKLADVRSKIWRFPFDDYPEDFTAIDNLNHRHQIEKDFGIFLNKNVDHKYRPITLKELSEKFQVAYSVDTRHLIKSTPGITTLLQSTVATLQQLIIILTNNTELFFFIHDNHRFKFVIDNWKFEEENVISDVSDYIQFQKDTSWDSVSYLFPADRE